MQFFSLIVALALSMGLSTAAPSVPPNDGPSCDVKCRVDQWLFKVPLSDFAAELKREKKLDKSSWAGIDWLKGSKNVKNDGCSVPANIVKKLKIDNKDKPGGFNFLPACNRHDFGYGNYRKEKRFTKSNRHKIDLNFEHDLFQNVCKKEKLLKQIKCELIATAYSSATRPEPYNRKPRDASKLTGAPYADTLKPCSHQSFTRYLAIMDDLNESIANIVKREGQPLIRLILAVQQHDKERVRFLSDFLSNLECFYFDRKQSGKPILLRETIDAYKDQNYVALSYTWGSSDFEAPSKVGGYDVQNRSGEQNYASPVRDSIFRRIHRYMDNTGVAHLWIDRHSIPQVPSTQQNAAWKQKAMFKKKECMQSMDFVYRLSKHPVALLGRPIQSEYEMELLHGVLTLEYTDSTDHSSTSELLLGWGTKAAQALELLRNMTEDLWWQRAWTFQKNYKGGGSMKLLVPHPPVLEESKEQYQIFGDIRGELCINSSHFSRQVTRFCLALREGILSAGQKKTIEYILRKAGRYTLLLAKSEAMTPAIIADVAARDLKEPTDLLPIIANCCDYSVRLDAKKISDSARSLSIRILTTSLLNGEILRNGAWEEPETNLKLSEFLKRHLLGRTFPTQVKESLTFHQGVRFGNVKLTMEGIKTKGCLWEVYKVMQTADFYRKTRVSNSRHGGLTKDGRRCLAQLSLELKARSETELTGEIKSYYQTDARGARPYQIGEDYMIDMAAELAAAIDNRVPLGLGRIWSPDGGRNRCRAIFVWNNTGSQPSQDDPALVLTSLSCGSSDVRDVDRHVSLGVRLQGARTGEHAGSIPRLYVDRGVFGMCFSQRQVETSVVFPWPPAFKGLVP
ncbi:hypothetical protein SCUP234_05096 [Seiridium cupressi]